VAESLARLAQVTGERSRADTAEAVTKIVTHHMADAVGATIAVLALRDGDHAKVLGLRSVPIRGSALGGDPERAAHAADRRHAHGHAPRARG